MDGAASDAGQMLGFSLVRFLRSDCILFWDHFLTLDTEIHYLWKRRKFASAYWFFVIRYLAVGGNIPGLVLLLVTIPTDVCLLWSLGYAITIVVVQILICIVMILRMYALYGRSRRVLWTLAGIGATLIGVVVYNSQGQTATTLTGMSSAHRVNQVQSFLCASDAFNSLTACSSYRYAASWGALLVFDSIIFGLTVYNGWSTRARMGLQATMPLHTLIIRDGALYFAIMVLSNLANIITFATTSPLLPGALATFANWKKSTLCTSVGTPIFEPQATGVVELAEGLGNSPRSCSVALTAIWRDPLYRP
ncbi:hypothetical protein FB451DRAFT_1369725 [Mycena latifolia]|nr:hypothetical protein FB451DRAFT_1369725 [Mycena latifolia]